MTLESPLPASLPAGSSLAVYCSGAAHDAGAPVTGFCFLVDGASHAPIAFAMPRHDLPHRLAGYWGVIPLSASPGREAIEIAAALTRAGGEPITVELGRVLVAEPRPPVSSGELIAICMATCNADRTLLAGQIESIRAQTDRNWTCVISDDHSEPEPLEALRQLVAGDRRFSISSTGERIGFYRNFERTLELAPADAGLLAFCDQDDVWHPDKLAALRQALGPAGLVYCDQRLVDERGAVLADSLWRGRANNCTNLASLLIANTVTGSAALFRREVAEMALPFPDCPGLEFHDHWIALVALATGEIRYLDRPLVDYVQHPRSVLGGNPARPGRRRRYPGRERGRSRTAVRRRARGRAAYFLGYMQGHVRASTLLLRFQSRMDPRKVRALRRYLSAERSLLGLIWLLFRPLRSLAGRNETLGSEWELARGLLWRRAAGILARPWLPTRVQLDARFPDPELFEQPRLARWRERMRPPRG